MRLLNLRIVLVILSTYTNAQREQNRISDLREFLEACYNVNGTSTSDETCQVINLFLCIAINIVEMHSF